ncbi:MAG: hypothetical protein WBA12_08570, partial [Catalinimonas sp.]
LAAALREVIPLAAADARARLPAVNGVEEGLALLAKQIGDFDRPDGRVVQTLTPGCLTTYTRVEKDDDEEEKVFRFDLQDLKPGSVEIEMTRGNITVTADTRDRLKYVQRTYDGEAESYDDEVAFWMPDLPGAKRLAHALRETIPLCDRTVEPQPFEWLSEAVVDGSTEDEAQTLEGDGCAAVMTVREDDDKERYDFNWFDLDARRTKLEVKGTQVQVKLRTRSDEKIIQREDEDGDVDYVDEVILTFADVETAKQVSATIKAMIDECQE